MATIGRKIALAQIGVLKSPGLPAWLLWSIVHIYFLIGFRSRAVVAIELGPELLYIQTRNAPDHRNHRIANCGCRAPNGHATASGNKRSTRPMNATASRQSLEEASSASAPWMAR